MATRNTRRRTFFIAPVAVLAITAFAYAAVGALDSNFGTGGVTATDYGPSSGNTQASDMAVQADGRIVLGGSVEGGPPHWQLRRYLTDGTTDTSFGPGGTTVVFADVGGMIHDVALDGSGRILATGQKGWSGFGVPGFALVRFNADGTPDATFGSGGVVAPIMGIGNSTGKAVAVLPSGKILVAGDMSIAGKKGTSDGAIFLARYNDNGTLDTSFGTGGVTTNNLTTGSDKVYSTALAFQSDGKIVLGGSAGSANWAITRYLANGLVDSTFSRILKSSTLLHGLSVDASDRILASGLSSGAIVSRYGVNGAVDTTFGTAGTATIAMTQGYANPICRPDGSIVLVGQVQPSTTRSNWTQAVAVRLLASGALDPSFGGSGSGFSAPIDVFPSFTVYDDRNEPMALGVAADGGILVAGRMTGSTGTAVADRHIGWFLGKFLPN